MSTVRDWHWTDEPTSDTSRRRTISNWSNYKTRAGEWKKTELVVRAATQDDEFLGKPLSYVASGAPMEFFVGDESSTGGLPWWGVRKSDSDKGIVAFVEGGGGFTSKTVYPAQKKVVWEDVLPDTDLILFANTHKVEKWLALTSPTAGVGGTGDRAVLGFVLPAGWTLQVLNSGEAGNRFNILDASGEVRLVSEVAKSFDASAEPRPVPTTFITPTPATATLGGVTYWRVRVRCAPAGYTYPILMDPTVTISGTAGISDTYLQQNLPDYNFGSTTYTYSYGTAGSIRKGLVRIDNPADIPAGTITACRLSAYIRDDNPAITFYRVSNANAWVEGRGTGAAINGETTWNKLKHGTPGTAWADSAGCSTSGVDYDAVAVGTYAAGPGGTAFNRRSIDLSASAPTSWRDDGVSNGVLYVNSGAVYVRMQSVEWADAAQRPYFEIDYTPPVVPPSFTAQIGLVKEVVRRGLKELFFLGPPHGKDVV